MRGTTKKEERTNKERGDRRKRTSDKKYHSDNYGESTPRDSASHHDERSSRNDASRASNRAQYDNSEREESVSRVHLDSTELNYTTTRQDSPAPISSSSGTYYTTPQYGQYAPISSPSASQYTTPQYQASLISTPTYPTADNPTLTYQYSSQSPAQSLPTISQTSGHAYPSYSQQGGQPPTFSPKYPPIGGGTTYPSGQQAQSSDADYSYDTQSPSNFRRTSSSNDCHSPSSSTYQPVMTARGYSNTTASYSSTYPSTPSYQRENTISHSSGTAPYTTSQGYGQSTPILSSPLPPVSLPDPNIPTCGCGYGNDKLCGVIIWPKPSKPLKPKDVKVKSSGKGESSSSKPSSSRISYKAQGSDGQNCGPLVLPGITPSPHPQLDEKDYKHRKEKWDADFREWKDISCGCGYGYFNTHGLWISGGDVRLWMSKGCVEGVGKPGNPRWKEHNYHVPEKSKHSREESKRKIYERKKED